ncbi:MAG: ATP-binding protein [Acidimicrobiales bacterium]
MQDQVIRAFASGPRCAAAARRWSRGVTQGWGVSATGDVVCLLASELVTNAVVHAGGVVQLALDLDDDSITVSVTDAGGGAVTRRLHDTDAPGGRGLQIVDALASAWGARDHPGRGKTVWATVRLQSGG